MDEICSDYDEEDVEDVIVECGNGRLYVSMKIPVDELGTPTEVAREMEEECFEMESDWREYKKEFSSSSKEGISSDSEDDDDYSDPDDDDYFDPDDDDYFDPDDDDYFDSDDDFSSSSQRIRSSSSAKRSSSSSVKRSSSSSVTSSSSEEMPESSSEDSGYSSSEEENSIYHKEVFNGMFLAPEPVVEDENTLYYEDFGDSVLCLYLGSTYRTGFSLNENMPSGQLEFFFRPHEDFFADDRVLIGSDGARLLVYYDSGNLVLMMNKTNVFRYISEPADILSGWNYVRVTWGDNSASLYLNNEKVGEMELVGGYEASTRSGEQELVIGSKSDCCMSGAGKINRMVTSADFGPIKVSVPKSVNR